MPRLDFYSNYKLFVRIKLEASDVLVGRGDDCTVQLPDERVSRHHALIRSTGAGYSLEDRSQNGTRVNDKMVHEAQQLAPGDRIYIESFVIVFQQDGAASETLSRQPTHIDHDQS